jgi:molybdopterin-guanine dinucleotide biosynthesis protein A
MKPATTASILAGGMSRRMGFNKAFIKVGGLTIIERSLATLRSVFDEVSIIADDIALYSNLGAPVWPDEIKGAGSLGGVYTALLRSAGGRVFVTACDMPAIEAAAIRRTVELFTAGDAAVPFIGGRYHPMHAVYSKSCIKPIEEMIRAGDLRINSLLDRITVQKLTEEDYGKVAIAASVTNINTQEDLSRAGIEI